MKKFIPVLITILLIVGIFPSGALADGYSLSISPDTITASEGETVSLTATVNNSGGEIAPYSIECGGTTCYSGSEASASFDFTVSSSMISSGSVTFELKSGGSTVATDTVAISKSLLTDLEVTLTPDPAAIYYPEKDDIVQFTFKIKNKGETGLDNITIKAAEISANALNTPFSLTPGNEKTVTYTKYTFKKDITIHFVISYLINNSGSEQTKEIAVQLVTYAGEVTATLTVDKSRPETDETVNFTLNIINSGNITYSNVKVLYNGKSLKSPVSTLKTDDNVSKDYPMSFQTSEDVQFVISLTPPNGGIKSIHTNTIKIMLPIDQEALKQNVSFVIKPDRTEMTSGGTVHFTGYVANNSEYDLSSVSVSDPYAGEALSVDNIASGSRELIDKQLVVDDTTTYNFVLTVSDRDGQQYTFNADAITVTIISDDTVPSETTTGEIIINNTKSSEPLLVWVIIAVVLFVLIILVGVAIIILWRSGRKSKSSFSPKNQRPPVKSSPRGKPPVKSSYRKQRPGGFKDRNHF